MIQQEDRHHPLGVPDAGVDTIATTSAPLSRRQESRVEATHVTSGQGGIFESSPQNAHAPGGGEEATGGNVELDAARERGRHDRPQLATEHDRVKGEGFEKAKFVALSLRGQDDASPKPGSNRWVHGSISSQFRAPTARLKLRSKTPFPEKASGDFECGNEPFVRKASGNNAGSQDLECIPQLSPQRLRVLVSKGGTAVEKQETDRIASEKASTFSSLLNHSEHEIEEVLRDVFNCSIHGYDHQVSKMGRRSIGNQLWCTEPGDDTAASLPLRGRHGAGRESLQDSIYRLLSHPDSSKSAEKVSMCMVLLIMFSSATFCMGTLPSLEDIYPVQLALFCIDMLAMLVFSVEFLLRFATVRDRRGFLLQPLNIIDLIALLPFYLDLSFVASGSCCRSDSLRVIMMLRVFRVLKLTGRMKKLQVIISAVWESLEVLGLLLFLLGLAVVILASLTFYAERYYGGNTGSDGPSLPVEQGFDSIPASFWWALVTLMTVGYGDMVPDSTVGKMIAAIAMVLSVIMMALPVSVIGANFNSCWMLYKHQAQTAARKADTWAKFLRLSSSLDELHQVLADLKQQLVVTQVQLDQLVVSMRSDLQRSRLLLLEGIVLRTPEATRKQVMILKDMQARLHLRMNAAWHIAEVLQQLMHLVEVVQCDAVLSKLELAHSTNKQITSWFEVGKNLALDVQQVARDLNEMSKALEEGSQPRA